MKSRYTTGELARKALHIGFGSVLLLTVYFNVFTLWQYYLLLFIGLTLSLSIKYFKKFPQVERLIAPFDKDDYLPAQGMVYFYVSFVILISLVARMELPDRYIYHPVLMLMFADPASFFIGKGFGKIRLPFSSHKTVEGTFAGMLVAVVIGLLFVPVHHAVAVGIGAMVMDIVDVKLGKLEIDDNLLIPLTAFVLLTLI